MATSPVRGDNGIVLSQCGTDAHCAGLLTHVRVDVTRKQVLGEDRIELVFTLANPVHADVEVPYERERNDHICSDTSAFGHFFLPA